MDIIYKKKYLKYKEKYLKYKDITNNNYISNGGGIFETIMRSLNALNQYKHTIGSATAHAIQKAMPTILDCPSILESKNKTRDEIYYLFNKLKNDFPLIKSLNMLFIEFIKFYNIYIVNKCNYDSSNKFIISKDEQIKEHYKSIDNIILTNETEKSIDLFTYFEKNSEHYLEDDINIALEKSLISIDQTMQNVIINLLNNMIANYDEDQKIIKNSSTVKEYEAKRKAKDETESKSKFIATIILLKKEIDTMFNKLDSEYKIKPHENWVDPDYNYLDYIYNSLKILGEIDEDDYQKKTIKYTCIIYISNLLESKVRGYSSWYMDLLGNPDNALIKYVTNNVNLITPKNSFVEEYLSKVIEYTEIISKAKSKTSDNKDKVKAIIKLLLTYYIKYRKSKYFQLFTKLPISFRKSKYKLNMTEVRKSSQFRELMGLVDNLNEDIFNSLVNTINSFMEKFIRHSESMGEIMNNKLYTKEKIINIITESKANFLIYYKLIYLDELSLYHQYTESNNITQITDYKISTDPNIYVNIYIINKFKTAPENNFNFNFNNNSRTLLYLYQIKNIFSDSSNEFFSKNSGIYFLNQYLPSLNESKKKIIPPKQTLKNPIYINIYKCVILSNKVDLNKSGDEYEREDIDEGTAENQDEDQDEDQDENQGDVKYKTDKKMRNSNKPKEKSAERVNHILYKYDILDLLS